MKLVNLLICLITLVVSLQAKTIYSNGYTFDINVTNKYGRIIRNADVDVYVSGNRANVEVEADGYRRARATIRLTGSQKTYRKRVRMDDASVFTRVVDIQGKQLNVDIDTSQFMVNSADQYGIKVRLFEKGYSKFGDFDVDISLNHSFVFGERIRVFGTDGNKVLEITVPRDGMREFTNDLVIEIPSDEQISKSRRQKVQKLQFKLQNKEQTKSVEVKELINKLKKAY